MCCVAAQTAVVTGPGHGITATGPSSNDRQAGAQLLGGTEEGVFGRLLSSAKHFANRAKAKALIVFQLEDHPLARRQLVEARRDLRPKLLALELTARIGGGPL